MATVQVNDNKIEVIIKAEGGGSPDSPDATKKKQPDKGGETADDVARLLRQGTSIASDLPVAGNYIGKGVSAVNSVYSATGSLITGGPMAIAALVVQMLQFGHQQGKFAVQSQRQADEMRRRAGMKRRND